MNNTLSFYVCKECGLPIQNGLCGYGCPRDSEPLELREEGTVEVWTFSLLFKTPYIPPEETPSEK